MGKKWEKDETVLSGIYKTEVLHLIKLSYNFVCINSG